MCNILIVKSIKKEKEGKSEGGRGGRERRK